jgi:vitamin B12 transporter
VNATWSPEDGLCDLKLGGLSDWNGFDHALTGNHSRISNGLSAQYDRRFGTVTATRRGARRYDK